MSEWPFTNIPISRASESLCREDEGERKGKIWGGKSWRGRIGKGKSKAKITRKFVDGGNGYEEKCGGKQGEKNEWTV